MMSMASNEKQSQQAPAVAAQRRTAAARGAVAGPIAQLAGEINASPRVQSLTQLQQNIDRGPHIQRQLDMSSDFSVLPRGDRSFDASHGSTGVLPGVLSVNDDLDRFKSIVYSYNGSIHSPNYLRILWGQLTFDCRLETLNIEYMLFTPSGVPLRAKLNTTFQQYLSPEKMQLKARNSSPDLTHSRVTSSRDTLPLLCFQIYGDSKYYLDIARINGLNDFRNLQPGQKIVFPPLGD